jgi:hypothetical protein
MLSVLQGVGWAYQTTMPGLTLNAFLIFAYVHEVTGGQQQTVSVPSAAAALRGLEM